MTREEIDEFFKLHEEAYRAHDFDALIALYAEDCVLESPIYGVVTGRAAIEQTWRQLLTRIPDLMLETEKLIVMGDEVAQVFAGTGTDMGGFFGTHEFGKPFRTRGVLLYVMKNGQIAHERRLYDVSAILLRRVEQELKMAAEIQQALLPHGRYCRPDLKLRRHRCPAGRSAEIFLTSSSCRVGLSAWYWAMSRAKDRQQRCWRPCCKVCSPLERASPTRRVTPWTMSIGRRFVERFQGGLRLSCTPSSHPTAA